MSQKKQVGLVREFKYDCDIFYTKILNFIFIIIFEILKLMNHREITKRYSELINRAEQANGRKEIVGLLKKAAKLKSKIEIN